MPSPTDIAAHSDLYSKLPRQLAERLYDVRALPKRGSFRVLFVGRGAKVGDNPIFEKSMTVNIYVPIQDWLTDASIALICLQVS